MSPALRGYLQVAAAAVLWGTLGVPVRSLLASGMSPLETAAWRASGAAAVLLLYCLLADRSSLGVRRGDLPLLATFGAVSVAGFMTVYFTAIDLATVATAAVLLYTAPAWVVILSRAIYGEAITPTKAAAVMLVFAGCALVVGAFGPGALRLSTGGLAAGLGAGLTYALYSIFGKAALRRHSPMTTVLYTSGFGAVLLVAAAGGLPGARAATFPAISYMVAAPTCAAYLLYIAGLRHVEAGRASVVATLEPVVAALAGTLLLREPMSAAQWGGAALVLGGVILVQGGALLRRAR